MSTIRSLEPPFLVFFVHKWNRSPVKRVVKAAPWSHEQHKPLPFCSTSTRVWNRRLRIHRPWPPSCTVKPAAGLCTSCCCCCCCQSSLLPWFFSWGFVRSQWMEDPCRLLEEKDDLEAVERDRRLINRFISACLVQFCSLMQRAHMCFCEQCSAEELRRGALQGILPRKLCAF